MNIKISIIIPVYNTEKFLRRCLDSCINQTLEEIEIIVVNDASQDQSDIIMQEYEKMYPQKVKCIYLRENVRQGGARNIAIRCAEGEFLTFVDSDDWIEQDMCEKLYDEAKKSKADIVYCNILRQKGDDYLIDNRFPNEAVGEVSKNIVEILTQPYVGPVPFIIKKNIIIDKLLYFPEKVVAEDTAITKLWDLNARKIVKIEGAYYVYCFNKASTGQAKMEIYRNDEFKCIKKLHDNLTKCTKVDKYKTECSLICMRYALNVLNAMIKRGGCRFKKDVEKDFSDCINYVCDGLIENHLWKYWFTPREVKCLLMKTDFDSCYEQNQINNVEDYRQYYKELYMEIQCVLEWFASRGKNRIDMWGKTDYALGLNKVFKNMNIIDSASDIDKYNTECIICLRTLHVPNIRKQLDGRNVEIFNLQGYLCVRGEFSKFCYDENYCNLSSAIS